MDLSNYTIQSELGRGGMATVFLAHDNKFDTNVAVKVLSKEFTINENIRKRFISEARNMFKMSHPNIIKVSDLIEKDDTVAFVMEYIEGETLKEYIDRNGKLSDEEIKKLFVQMLDAVGYVHKQKLVHRDIKPSNFMINHEGHVKLMDFGIAKTTDTSSAEYTQTGTGVQMGTPMYMSPEQITETKSVTAQSDIYSLGVVLWQMATGKKPYDTSTISTFELQMKIVQDELPLTSSFFDEIIQIATHKELDNRFKNCNELINRLSNVQNQIFDKTEVYIGNNSEKTTVLSEPIFFEEVKKLAKEGKKLEAVKLLHDKSGMGLKESKDWVDNIDNTVVESVQKSNIGSKQEINIPNTTSKQNENLPAVFIMLGIVIFILIIYIISENNYKDTESTDDYIEVDSTSAVLDDYIEVDSTATDLDDFEYKKFD